MLGRRGDIDLKAKTTSKSYSRPLARLRNLYLYVRRWSQDEPIPCYWSDKHGRNRPTRYVPAPAPAPAPGKHGLKRQRHTEHPTTTSHDLLPAATAASMNETSTITGTRLPQDREFLLNSVMGYEYHSCCETLRCRAATAPSHDWALPE